MVVAVQLTAILLYFKMGNSLIKFKKLVKKIKEFI